MNFAEIKEAIARLSVEERLELMAFIIHLDRSNDSEYQSELDRRMSAMDAEDKIFEEEFKVFN